MIRRLPPLPALFAIALASLVTACATPSPQKGAVSAPSEKPANMREAGLERVLGKTQKELVALFVPADLDQHESAARKVQFVGPVCVLDAYLSAPREGAEPVVT